MDAKRITKDDGCLVPSLEELADLCRAMSAANVTLLRRVCKDHLARALTWLIVQFEGPHLVMDEASDGRRPGRIIRVFIHLAQRVAERAVKNVLGRRFSALDYLELVDYLIDVRNAAEDRIANGTFEKSEFYRQIVDLIYAAAARAP